MENNKKGGCCMGNSLFDTNLQISYKGKEFTLIDTLYVEGGDLLLVVNTSDLKEKQFPLPTFVIPKED